MRVTGRTLRVGPVRFAIGRAVETNECGSVDVGAQQIHINAEYGDDIQTTTIIHEAIHAILQLNQYHRESSNEKMVDCLANGITSLLRDNKWLLERLR